MLGVYNDAILYNQELLTPTNAQVFHKQFQRLLMRAITFLNEKDALEQKRELLAQREKRQARQLEDRKHLVGFLMTPFSSQFELVRKALRMVIEDRLSCELRTAETWTLDDLIRGNVEAHLDEADFFIADVTGANPMS